MKLLRQALGLFRPRGARQKGLYPSITKPEGRFLIPWTNWTVPGFDGRTAMQLVQEGKAQQVLEYIDAGAFA